MGHPARLGTSVCMVALTWGLSAGCNDGTQGAPSDDSTMVDDNVTPEPQDGGHYGELDGSGATPRGDAGHEGDPPGAGGERDAGHEDVSPDAGGASDAGPLSFDTSAIRIGAVHEVPCSLSADRRRLVVRVQNDGPEVAPPLTVQLATRQSEHKARLETPELEPGAFAELAFERGAVAGFRPEWEFEVSVDPDGLHGAAGAKVSGRCGDLRARTRTAMEVLYGWYDQASGLFNRNEWWRGANMLEVSIDYARETGDSTFIGLIENTFEKNEKGTKHPDGWTISHGNFLNEYYDDEGWWALAWIKAYDLTHQQKYLDMAKTIFNAMLEGWDDKCGGGLYWRTPHEAKNAIPNELFLTIAARLHLRTPGDTTYLEWAKREWAWFKSTGMITAQHQVIDGLRADCSLTGPAYTYNQGVILGGLVELWRATGDTSLLDQADAIAHAALEKMTNADGVFIETVCDNGGMCDGNFGNHSDGCRCDNGDGVQFKGVFARNLALLYEARPWPEYQTFLITQSESIWNRARSGDNKVGLYWQGAYDNMGDAARQSSAMDALIGAVRVAEMNLALRGSATGSNPCNAAEGPEKAIDGNAKLGSKWCSGGTGGQTLRVDLGAVQDVVGFRVRHAGAGGEDPTFNTRDFRLSVSEDGQTWRTSVTVVDNEADITTHYIPSTPARYVRLEIMKTQTAAEFPAARVYELEVLGSHLRP